MAVLVLADHDQGVLSPSTARVIAAAQQLGGSVDVLVAGQGVSAIAASVAALSGVTRVLTRDDAALAEGGAETLVSVLEALAPAYDHILVATTAVGRDVMPRLAARLDLMPVTDVVTIHGPQKFDRPIYAGNAVETVSSNQAKQLLTVRASAFRPVVSSGAAPVEAIAGGPVAALAKFIAAHRTAGDTPDLSTAQIVVAGGQSVKSADGFKLVEAFAARLGAAVGATRAAVDAGYAPNDWQVGQTGKIIAPDLYIAIGISGALQHLAGIQGAKKIIAINSDPDSPLMKLADYAYVGDLFAVLPELTAELDRLGVK